MTTHNIYKRQTSVPPAGIELAIPASERLQTLDLKTARRMGSAPTVIVTLNSVHLVSSAVAHALPLRGE